MTQQHGRNYRGGRGAPVHNFWDSGTSGLLNLWKLQPWKS